MDSSTYLSRRAKLTTYFDQTAASAWQALTSNAPVSRVRATVRAGRDEMRTTLLGWMPTDLSGRLVVDAGCGTGALAIEAAQRGASVVAIDVAGSLVDVARQRTPPEVKSRIDYRVGDMTADIPRDADYIVAMDSLIHYSFYDVLDAVAKLADCANEKLLFTSAPWTPALALMHLTGRVIPRREDRAPAIEPIRIEQLRQAIDSRLGGEGWRAERTRRIQKGFYISQAIEVVSR